MKLRRLTFATLAGLVVAGAGLNAQVTDQNLLNAAQEPQNWLSYSGNYSSQRYSTLEQITRSNAKDLQMQWVFQADSLQKMEASPIVANGVMYVTQAPNENSETLRPDLPKRRYCIVLTCQLPVA